MKARGRGRRTSAWIVFECLETLIKYDARVFEIASQSRVRNKSKWKYSRIFHMPVSKFVVMKNCIVIVICLFRKGVANVITTLWMIINSKFFTIFCTAIKVLHFLLQWLYHVFVKQNQPMKRPSWWKVTVPYQSPLVTKINGPMEYLNNDRNRDW